MQNDMMNEMNEQLVDGDAIDTTGNNASSNPHEAKINSAAAEFPDDPGTGFGFVSNDEVAREIAAESAVDGEAHDDATDDATDDDHAPLTDEERSELSQADAEARTDADEAAAAYARASMRDFDAPVESAVTEADEPVDAHRGDKPRQLVIVNDVPGDETRIAILEQGRLTQFYSERAATSTNVGSIYKARVVNVEPAIQAAFVDFGEGANGFLHISDLHPKYFPGDMDKTEKVGRKIPRRSRPMMQEALRRGQEIVVQVLKEGLGSKGPTVTSYLSIPGRLLVMMPDMDNVGVSRKVDDEDSRRQMRKILDSLNLPEGFGFILRTAGFDSTRTELARDAQYLTRLWQVMDKRMNAVGAPCSLYTEGDILLRTIRDCIDSAVDGIVVDSESAFHRAKAFLDVVAPKTSARVHFYDRRMPIFHAFDVERQVDMIHSREVPLLSGGALVIDQTEALVAIDVNSGRSRSARDSETNAYQTNQEAVDEIARQIRLRDLGGVIVSDLIDMRMSKHRRDIEDRLKQNLSKDRAKSTVTEISEFGIVEMTRQRMRPSLRKTHYMDCPHCSGHGEIRMPDTVASDAMRRMQLVLDMEKVARIEVVCSSKVAAVLLSRKRRAMGELEELFGKKIEVRISEAIAVDRVDLYAYDDRNADVDLDRPLRIPTPSLASLPTDIEEDEHTGANNGSHNGSNAQDRGDTASDGQGRGGRRRRRRRKPAAADATSIILSGGFDDLPDIDEDEESVSQTLARVQSEDQESGDSENQDESREGGGESSRSERGGRRGRRGRGRGGRGGREQDGATESKGSDDGRSHAPKPAPYPNYGRTNANDNNARAPRAVKPIAPPAPPREPSEPIRVHALAKEIELTSKEVLAKCAELGVEVKGHQSLLTGEQGDAIRKVYGKAPFDVPEVVAEPETDSADGESSSDGAEGGLGQGELGQGGRRKRRRRRGRGGRGRDGGENGQSDGDAPNSGGEGDAPSSDESAPRANRDEGGSDESSSDGDGGGGNSDGSTDQGGGQSEGGERKRRSRRGRGGRGRSREDQPDGAPSTASANASANVGQSEGSAAPSGAPRTENREQRGGQRGEQRGQGRSDNRGDNRGQNRNEPRSDNRGQGGAQGQGQGGERGQGGQSGERSERGGRNRRGGRGRNRGGNDGGRGSGSGNGNGGSEQSSRSAAPAPQSAAPQPAAAPTPSAAPKPPKPRSLYGGRLRKLSPGEMPKGGGDE